MKRTKVSSRTIAIAAIAACAALCLVSVPAAAQFGGFRIPVPGSASSARSSDGCPKGRSSGGGRAIFGSILGQAAGRAASSAGVSSWVPTAAVADQLTNAIACRLDPAEQQQAASATLEATRAADTEVGATANWTSQTRENVSGTSTVTGKTAARDGASCISVTDVIIVNGEETTANKRMCRPPGSARYSLAA